MYKELRGIIPAMLTPITNNQTINEEVTRELVNKLIDKGIHGLFILGTNGEFHVLSDDEKVNFTQIVVDEVNGRVPVIVGVGGNSTAGVIQLSNRVEDVGADMLSVITPYFIPPTQDEIIAHYEAIASETKLPILLYNIPSRTGVDLELETVKRLAKMPSIIAIKDSSGNFNKVKDYIDATKDEDFSVLIGTDSLILKTLQAGGSGAIAATANAIPEHVVAIYENWLNGNIDAAEKYQEQLQPLRETFAYGTIPSVLKKTVELLLGTPVGPPKMPVSEPTGDVLEKIKEVVSFYKNNR